MSLIINNDYSIEQSFDDKYNMEINDCLVEIRIYCRNNNLPFFNKLNCNDFKDVIKKNINFSKINVINIDNIESSEEELSDGDYSD